MCIAELNVSLLPCRHRWYHLVRNCTPSSNLANCQSKLAISGWEIKCEFCPYCSAWNLSTSEYRLVGNDRAPALGGLSRMPSLTLTTTRRDSRRGSLSRSDSNTSITMMASEKNRAMNARVDAYFRVAPPETAPLPLSLPEVDDEDNGATALSPSDTSSDGHDSLRQSSTSTIDKSGLMQKMRFRSKKLSLSLFK